MPQKVITTYLELAEKDRFQPREGFLEKIEVREVANDAYINFILFAGVGLPWRWYSRLGWTAGEWDKYFAGGMIGTYLCFEGKNLVGYYEIDFTAGSSAEIKFMGLFPRYMGRGLGGMVLSHAVHSAREKGAGRVWLHTCTNDAEAALGNYLARGFRVFKEEEGVEEVPGRQDLVKGVSRFIESYIESYDAGLK